MRACYPLDVLVFIGGGFLIEGMCVVFAYVLVRMAIDIYGDRDGQDTDRR